VIPDVSKYVVAFIVKRPRYVKKRH